MTSGSSNGARPCWGDGHARHAHDDIARDAGSPLDRAAHVPRGVLRVPGRGDRHPRAHAGRRPRPLAIARGHHRSRAAQDRVVHGVAGHPVDRAHGVGGDAGGVRAVALRVSRSAPRARAGDGAVRAPDRGRRLGVRERARPGWPARVPRARSEPRRDPDRPRVLQLRGGRAHGRWAVGAPRSAPGGGGTDARRKPVARVPRGHPARAAARDRGGERHRVPLHVHVVRRDPDPRWAAHLDPRDRDLPPDRAAARSSRRGRPHHRAARRRRRVARRSTPGSRAALRTPWACARRSRPHGTRERPRNARCSRGTSR